MLLDAASDDIPEADNIRRLMRDLREVRMAKMRAGVAVLEGGREVKMNGVGGMEVSEGRAFIGGVVDELRYVIARSENGVYVGAGANPEPAAERLAHRKSFHAKNERRTNERTASVAQATTMTKTTWTIFAEDGMISIFCDMMFSKLRLRTVSCTTHTTVPRCQLLSGQ